NTLPVPQFSVKHGFYENSFNLNVYTETTNASIKYTLDGSDPRYSASVIIQSSPAVINIDPESTTGGRGKTPGVTLRACTLVGDTVSESVTQTYLFISKIGELSPDKQKPGTGWPDQTTSGQWIDYGMDPNILNDSRYASLIDDAMLAIPSISITTDLKNLFSPDSGIYVNAMQDGMEWERPASIELIFPDSTEGFQINAGLRIRGGWSRHPENPKHAFRLFFRQEYGKGKLEYPMFGNEGVDEFDKMDLRTSQNYSWSYPGHQGEYNTMNRDVFSRDLQREMGQPYTRSRYYHLYINGYYWGIFQSQERPEARFAASYFGGSVEDYDVIKMDTDNYTIEATDGNLTAYQTLWNMCVSGFQNNTNYFRLLGLNTDGTVNPSYNVLLDVDNLIDYMLVIFYAGNFDSPTSKFGNNKGPNNFYCIYNRNGKEGFKFFAHDAEHTLRTTAGEGPGIGLNENRVNIGDLNDGYKMTVSSFSGFHPQWLHYKLTQNAEYRIRFADHVYKHFFNEGCMTPGKVSALFLSRANEIDSAIIGESARWGDEYLNPPGTQDLWQWAVDDIVNNYFPYRTNIVLNQLKDAGLYPNIDPPEFINNDAKISAGSLEVEPDYVLKIQNPNSTNGSILFTLDSKDPRLIGGETSGSAQDGGDEIELPINSTTVIKARVKNGTTWSALHEIILFTSEETSNLKITEIHYHPLDSIAVGDTINDNEYEFLELKNTGSAPINLSLANFIDGITYTFPEGTIIEPGNFIVLASNQVEFNSRYGFIPFGDYSGQLNNSGETITLVTSTRDTIFSVTYSDQAPWPALPDGNGNSLVPTEINPTGDLHDPANWRASYAVHGSPGRDDLLTSAENLHQEIPERIELYQNYPNPFNPSTEISYALKNSGKIHLSVFDLLGREVSVLVNEFQKSGKHKILFSEASLSSGIYFYRLRTPDGIITKKMLLLK
ncbi:MAG TPA: CotH kinase family protein, partial [Ignavibacteriaceae bacterium]|nr:CotH kinase family protein [Ignavibacteriaceae bacterium]